MRSISVNCIMHTNLIFNFSMLICVLNNAIFYTVFVDIPYKVKDISSLTQIDIKTITKASMLKTRYHLMRANIMHCVLNYSVLIQD